MKQIVTLTKIFTLLLITCSFTLAQNSNEYRLNLKSGKLYVNDLDKVTFGQSEDGDVVITNKNQSSSKSDRAKGLKLINGLGLDDNTGIGLNIESAGDKATVNQISRNSSSRYTIQVPKDVIIVYENGSVHANTVLFDQVNSEIEVTTTHGDVQLDGVTGPMTINTVHGDIEGDFSTVDQSNPISIFSSHGDIDLAIPNNTKADLSLSTGWGEIYSDLDIVVNKGDSSMKRYGENNVYGNINGGGISIKVASTHGSIYLRKK